MKHPTQCAQFPKALWERKAKTQIFHNASKQEYKIEFSVSHTFSFKIDLNSAVDFFNEWYWFTQIPVVPCFVKKISNILLFLT